MKTPTCLLLLFVVAALAPAACWLTELPAARKYVARNPQAFRAGAVVAAAGVAAARPRAMVDTIPVVTTKSRHAMGFEGFLIMSRRRSMAASTRNRYTRW